MLIALIVFLLFLGTGFAFHLLWVPAVFALLWLAFEADAFRRR